MKEFYVVSYNDASGCYTDSTCYTEKQVDEIIENLKKYSNPHSSIDVHYYKCEEEIKGDKEINEYLDSFFDSEFEPSENIIKTININ